MKYFELIISSKKNGNVEIDRKDDFTYKSVFWDKVYEPELNVYKLIYDPKKGMLSFESETFGNCSVEDNTGLVNKCVTDEQYTIVINNGGFRY